MPDRLTIEITGDFIPRLERAAAQLEHPDELMRMIGRTLERNIGRRFETKTDPTGAPWAPLAKSTLERKKGRGSILMQSGRGPGSLGYNAGADFVEVGFGVAYMGYHETGTRRMPRRGLLTADWQAGTLGAQDERDLLDEVTVWLSGLGL